MKKVMGNAGKTYKVTENIYFAEVEDEVFLTLEELNVVVCLNPAAFVLLQNLDGFNGVDYLADAFARRDDREAKSIKAAVEKAIEQLAELKVIVPVEAPESGKRGTAFISQLAEGMLHPEIVQVWQGKELSGGLFVNSEGCDIHVIVPNVTEGPIKTCPPHTCTIPAGLFTPETIIRTFDENWNENFKAFRKVGLTHRMKRGR